MGSELSLAIQVESRDGVVRIALVGELDMLTVPELVMELKRLEAHPVSAIVLDLRDLTFLDSSGLQAFVNIRSNAESNGHRLILVGVRDSARRLFEFSGTEFLLEDQDPVSLLGPFTRDPAARGADAGMSADA